jgi:ATP-binding cassette, subfamily B, bacterial PglK
LNSIKRYFQEVFYLLGDQTKKLPFLVLLFLFGSSLDLLGIGLMGPFISLVISPEMIEKDSIKLYLDFFNIKGDTRSILYQLSIFLLILFVFKAFISIIINRTILYFCFRQGVRIRGILTKGYQELPYDEYVKRNSAEYIYRIFNLAGQFPGNTLSPLLKLLSEGIVVICIFIFLLQQSWEALFLLSFILILSGIIYDLSFRKKVTNFGLLANQRSEKMLQGINEAVLGLKEIRVLEKENYFFNKVDKASIDAAEMTVKSQFIASVPRYMIELILVVFILLLVLTFIIFNIDMQDIVVTLSMFGVAAIRLAPSTNFIVSGITLIRFGRNGLRILYEDMVCFEKEETQQIKKNTLKKGNFESLELRDIAFSFDSSKKAINNVSLKILSGQSIGLIGESGSGKTTLADIILGLLEPQTGEVILNNSPLIENISELRSQVAYLPQEVFLIDASLKNNIALGVEDELIDLESLENAIQKSSLRKTVTELPDGLDTILGERGVRLSGGQRQRVALARAFYHQKNVLVMDESTSALDDKTEKEIVQSIASLKGQTTTIVIAHRLTTLANCDLIIKMHNGEIIESGSYQEVIQRKIDNVR